jgi:hypothetical protein
MNPLPRHTRLGAAALLLALCACGDRVEPLAPIGIPESMVPVANIVLPVSGSAAECGVSIQGGGTIQCLEGDGSVEIVASGASYNAGTGMFTFDVTVYNGIGQPIGTSDAATLAPDAGGVRVFFEQGPVVSGGVGTVSVIPDGFGVFTAAGQPYYQYNTVLEPEEMSPAKTWQFVIPPTVTTFYFKLRLSAAVPYPDGWIDVTPADSPLPAGDTRALTATVRDAAGQPVTGQTVGWTTSNSAVATVNAPGVVTGVAPGTATITASTTSPARTGTATVQVCPTLAVGAVYYGGMPEGSRLCLGGGAAGAEYTIALANTSAASPVALSLTATGNVPVSGPPSPDRIGAAPTLSLSAAARHDVAFDRRLREREARERGGLLGRARGSVATAPGVGPRRALLPGTPIVGDLVQLNVKADNDCSINDPRTARVAAVGTHAVVLADTGNPAGGFATADFQDVAARFDTLVWPTLTGNFGAPDDLDGNGRVALFFTRAVNERTPTGGAYLGGYFLKRDLFSPAACATSNGGELIYLAAPDPAGTVNGNARTAAFVKAQAALTLGHELQHLVNASRRLYVNGASVFEDPWLDEALSNVAEELLFHAASGKAPKQNLGAAQVVDGGAAQAAFVAYAAPNYAQLREWLLAPHANGLFQPDADRATTGAGWAFLRYLADRKAANQPAFWNALVNSTAAGIANVEAVLGRGRA